ncbi:copper amine oxidase N-terminal domain-containing protein [Cohnella rhizosphaerae]|uniref:Copper amine oxidase N-terminal domain-containing protein n=1 Tax=Cohnella rhizosphaerae TaxID=1457232 RepID=A0A9X4KT02_9BACL|nr:copper amine oxidase N-terminal domain-containing protein [Cohnella rhizosphaerae]MDG0810305.1 copper amine oxidase N-terminal domain-containing protein [Cohnella rhizosphaerae]
MKKRILFVLMMAVLVNGFTLTASAASKPPTFVSVVMDGMKLWFPDAQAFVDDNQRTLVPVRFVAEALGAKVGWEAGSRAVPIQKGDQSIRLTIGSKVATVNSEEVAFDTQAVMQGGRTFVPLRFVSEILGVTVEWDDKTNTVLLSTKALESKNDPWGRLIRTSNLPSNAADYPYILADIPNAMYELAYPYSDPEDRKVSSTLYSTISEYNKENVDIWLSRLKTFGALWLNVDYRTIDDAWAQALFATKLQNSDAELKYIRQYVEWVKENKIQVEGYLDPEPSMIYYDGFGGDYIRVKFRIKFVSFDKQDGLLYDEWFPKDAKFEKNVWYEGYSDIKMKASVGGDWGNSLKVSSTASLFFNHTISKVE